MENQYFSNVVGQPRIKRKLQFFLDAHKASGKSPFLLFSGPAGLGKTEFAIEYAKGIKANTGSSDMSFYEINCSTIKNPQAFLEEVHQQCVSHQDSIILLDEAHALPKSVMNLLLSVFNTKAQDTYDLWFGGELYEFDFRRNVFIFATTETDKLFPPLKSRLEVLDFNPYKTEELAEIIREYDDGVNYEEEALFMLSSTIRGTARDAVKAAKNVVLFCERANDPNFTSEMVMEYFQIFGINPYGLTDTEVRILEVLEEGSASLGMLGAITGFSSTALKGDHEKYLLKQGFIMIDGHRHISNKGRKAIRNVRKDIYLDKQEENA